jgi:hypothetical protein
MKSIRGNPGVFAGGPLESLSHREGQSGAQAAAVLVQAGFGCE